MTSTSSQEIAMPLIRFATVALALVLLATPAAAQDVYGRNYNTRILEPAVAEAIAWAQCEDSESQCAVTSVSPASITITADPATHAKISAALAAAQKVPSAQVFQVTLIEAENNGDRGLGNVPEPARAALSDARGFLPFNGYKLLGTAVLRTNDAASAMVSGPGGGEYNCEINFYHAVNTDGHQLVLRRFSLARMPPKMDNGQYVDGAAAIDILNTSFGMKPGETVVVGTSKLEGANQALVVLLTALD
jgi:hypothetical protein